MDALNFRLGTTHAVAQLRAFVVCEQSLDDALTAMTLPSQVAGFWRDVVAKAPAFDADKECVAIVILNRKNKVLGWNMVSLGSATMSLAHPREVLRAVLAANGTAFVMMHNHPSGDPVPSAGDIQCTRQMKEAAKTVDIEFLDHVIVGQAKEDPLGRGFSASGRLGYYERALLLERGV